LISLKLLFGETFYTKLTVSKILSKTFKEFIGEIKKVLEAFIVINVDFTVFVETDFKLRKLQSKIMLLLSIRDKCIISRTRISFKSYKIRTRN